MKLKYKLQIVRVKDTISAVPVGKNAGEFLNRLVQEGLLIP